MPSLPDAIRELLAAVQSKADYSTISERCDRVRVLLVTVAGAPLPDLQPRAAELEAKLTHPAAHWFDTSRSLALKVLKVALDEATPKKSPNDPRDKFCYLKRKSGKSWKWIKDEVNKREKWEPCTTIQAAQQAARRYADRNQLPRLIQR